MDFTPCYTWPNKAFPFRNYYNGQGLRIFIIENIFHNHEWLKRYAKGIGDRDKFIVILGWHHGDWHAKHSKDCINDCGIDIDNFHILCNDIADFAIFSEHGFNCHLVNQNCFLDYNLFSINEGIQKIYDAIYVARLTPFKRHYLCDQVPNLALVCGDLHGGAQEQHVPPHAYINDVQLSPNEVQNKICQARTGLILSEIEGACFASSEYLLCGVPVVSTRSHGGRDAWYNDYNSIVCEPTPEDVAMAVRKIASNPPNPERVREQHIVLTNFFRANFVSMLQMLFDQNGVSESAHAYFKRNFIHKMRDSISPEFDSLFSW